MLIFSSAGRCSPNVSSPLSSRYSSLTGECDRAGLNPFVSAVHSIYSTRGNILSKNVWKKQVWDKAWLAEKNVWNYERENNRHLDLVKLTMAQPGYARWWSISDLDRRYMRKCELMVKIICHTSSLKSDDCRLRGATFGDVGGVEDARHVIMQCSYQEARCLKRYVRSIQILD